MKWYSFPRQALPSSLVFAMTLSFFFQGHVAAQQLPSIGDQPWLGFFSGYKRRGFEFGINNEGQCEIYLIGEKTKKRVGHTRIIKIYAEVIVENDQGKLFTKRLKKDEGFSTEQKAGLKHDEVKFNAECTGDAKVEITIKYDRDRIILDGRVLDRGTLKTGKLYFSFKVRVPAMYGSIYNNADKKKLKSAMRRDRIKFTRAVDKKRVSLKSYKEVDLADEEMAKGGVTNIIVSMAAQEGMDFIFTTLDGTGVINFENNTAPLWKGYSVLWKREFTEESTKDGDNNKPAQGISPLVIELK